MKTMYIATTNTDKIRLMQSVLDGYGYTLIPCDPGDGEQRMPVGYESAAIGKVLAARDTLQADDIPILGLDSGYEFESMHGFPGPLSGRALRNNLFDLNQLTAGSTATVVHCTAVLWHNNCGVFTHADNRTVVSRTLESSQLPMTSLLEGPQNALALCAHDMNQWLEKTRQTNARIAKEMA